MHCTPSPSVSAILRYSASKQHGETELRNVFTTQPWVLTRGGWNGWNFMFR